MPPRHLSVDVTAVLGGERTQHRDDLLDIARRRRSRLDGEHPHQVRSDADVAVLAVEADIEPIAPTPGQGRDGDPAGRWESGASTGGRPEIGDTSPPT